MMIPRIAATALAATALLATGGCNRKASQPRATQAWVRLPAVAGQPAAAYFTVSSGSADRLVKVETALAERAELHESMAGAHGMMTMKPLAGVDVPAGGAVTFAPGGRHVMLFGLDPQVKAGTGVPLRFGFASGRTAEAEAKTVNTGDPAP